MPTLAYTVLAYTIADLCKATGIGRSKVYLDLKSGKLRAKKHGKRTIITESEARRWLDALPARSPNCTPPCDPKRRRSSEAWSVA
jgi:excisionase family DNA binding protein